RIIQNESIYPADILFDAHTKRLDFPFKDRCLLSTTNLIVWDLNDEVYKRFPSVEVAYQSHDKQELDDITGGWEETVECQSAVNTTSNIEAQDWHARHLHSQSHGTCGTSQRFQGHCDRAA
ncbi:hypothetical protein GcC1_085031, partial [Golovinomyces cichoracearum]